MNRQSLGSLSQFVSTHKLSLFEEIIQYRTRHLTVVLEDIFQPHNASACLRSCDCFGIQDIHVIENEHTFRVDREVTLGAAQRLTPTKHNRSKNNTLACLDVLRQNGYRIIATLPGKDGCLLEDYDVSQKTAILFGTEMHGLSLIARKHAEEFLNIPMYSFTESFNLSVAVAICLHSLTWKLCNSNVDLQLGDEERESVKSAWVKHVVGKRLKQHNELFWNLIDFSQKES